LGEIAITRIDNFQCPACGEIIRQVAARDGIVKGWCPHAKKEIKVNINEVCKVIVPEPAPQPQAQAPLSYLDNLKQQRAKVLKDVVSAREDGDLKENSAYHAAREQLSILDDKILHEEEKLKQLKREEQNIK
jgi:hypothetical protein